MIYLGIDNGIGGGLASYNSETNELEVIPMPIVSVAKAKGNKNEYNLQAIIEWLRKFQGIKVAVLERAQAFPGQSVQSTFSFARTYGIMEGILATLGIPYRIVAPKSWQAKIFEGVPHKGRLQNKQASILVAQRLFPNTKFIASETARKIHDGMTDAALMAMYASQI